MLLILYLTLSLCVLTHCDSGPSDEVVDAAFREIENALKDREDIKSMIADVKNTLTTKPDYKKNFVSIAQSVVSAVPMLKSDNGYTIAQGALNLAAGIASNIPGGTIFASIATLLSSVIGIIDKEKTDKIRDTMAEVLRESRDKDLKDQVDGFKHELNGLLGALKGVDQADMRDMAGSDISKLLVRASSIRVIGVLRSRIHEYRISHDPIAAKHAFEFSVMYGQLVTLEELVITKVCYLFQKKYPGSVKIHTNTKNTMIDGSRIDLSFWNNPIVEHAGALVYYYPLGSSERGKFLRSFLERLKVPEPEPWNPARYVLISIRWPTYHLYFKPTVEGVHEGAMETLYLSYSSNTPKKKDKIIFHKQSDGYYTLRSMRGAEGMEGRDGGYAFLGFPKNPYYVYGENRHRGDDNRYQFIVISYPGTDIITISCRNWPYKFFSGEANKFSVILRDGNSGSDIQFYTNPCLVNESGSGSQDCPHYTPKTR